MKKNVFYCEACGAKVKSRAESCPSCGRSFLGIRCPRCGREGPAEEFLKGCPDCGYSPSARTDDIDEEASRQLEWPKRRTRRPDRPLWPASRYLTFSLGLIVSVLVILYLWIK